MMVASPQRLLFVVVPGCLLLGAFSIVSEVKAHGLSGAVVAGLAAGAIASVALVAVCVLRWHRKRLSHEAERTRQFAARTLPWQLAAYLLCAVAITAVRLYGGEAGRSLGSLALVGFGVVFIVVSGVLATMAIAPPRFMR